MEKMVGFKDERDVAVLNKLLGQLNRNKADVRYLLQNRITDVSTANYASAKYTANMDDVCLLVTAPAAVITLPSAGKTGKMFWVKNASGGPITINVPAGNLIEGSPTMVFADKVCRQCIDIRQGEWDVI